MPARDVENVKQACVLEEAAIKILPMDLAKGMLGKHYRLGWEEKSESWPFSCT